jgi:hypothetical protein
VASMSAYSSLNHKNGSRRRPFFVVPIGVSFLLLFSFRLLLAIARRKQKGQVASTLFMVHVPHPRARACSGNLEGIPPMPPSSPYKPLAELLWAPWAIRPRFGRFQQRYLQHGPYYGPSSARTQVFLVRHGSPRRR